MSEYDPAAAFDMVDEGYQNGDDQYTPQQDVADEDDDYDPSSFNADDSAEAANTTDLQMEDATPLDAPKPKTVGGFIVDDEDEEEDAVPPPSQLNGTEGAQSGLGAAAVAQAQDVPVASEPSQDTAAQSAGFNGPAQPSVVSASHTPSNVSTTNFSFQPPALPSRVASEEQQGKQELQSSTAAAQASQSVTATPQPQTTAAPAPPPQTNGSVPATPTTQRLPHDKVGQLEDRIKDDPRADTDAWMTLISHYREKGQLDQVRSVYERFFKVFPDASPIWVEYVRLELDQGERPRADAIFGNALPNLPALGIWSQYLDYLRRFFPLMNDTQGSNRQTIDAGFQAILGEVGIDPESGMLWREYIDFIKSGEGVIGGVGWKDQQKADFLRVAYHRAVRHPHSELMKLWKEYDNFEMTVNKGTARKQIQEQSPHYMTARAAKTQMDQRLEGLDRTSLPTLPPLYGCQGEDEFGTQVEKWRGWIAWEKEDPLVLEDEDIAAYRNRVLFAYKQAVMHMRFYPEMWFDAASWCFSQLTDDFVKRGERFLDRGLQACPESVLLGLRKADRVEESLEGGNSETAQVENGNKVEPVYESVLSALYALNVKTQQRRQKALEQVKQHFASLPPEDDQANNAQDDDDDSYQEGQAKPKGRAEQEQAQIRAISVPFTAHLDTLKRTISSVWVAKMRCFNRLQGAGTGKPVNGLRGFRTIFSEARPRGCLSSAVYIASAHLELTLARDQNFAKRVFERGLKLFPTDEEYALAYMKYLTEREGDGVNALAVFEQTVSKIMNASEKIVQGGDDEKKRKVRPLYEYMHGFTSANADLRQIRKLETRMRELFPDGSEVGLFASRFALPQFDPMAVQLIISPTQAQPAQQRSAYNQPGVMQRGPMPGMESPNRGQSPMGQASNIRLGPNGPYIASPKRGLDDSDADNDPSPRKFQRAESPFKGGGAGRRVPTHSAQPSITNMGGAGAGSAGFAVKNFQPGAPPIQQLPPPLPKAITDLLAVIPGAAYYTVSKLDSRKFVELLRTIDVNQARRF